MRELGILGALVLALCGCPGGDASTPAAPDAAPGDGARVPDAAPGDDAPVLDAAPGDDAAVLDAPPGDDAHPAVATVTVDPTALELVPGSAIQLTAETRDASGTVLADRVVVWMSSDTAVADVSATGLVSAVNPGGPVTIAATSEGQSGSALVTVLDAPMVPVAHVSVEPQQPTLIVGVSVPMTVQLLDATGTILTGRVVTWTSSDPDVVAVSPDGVISAIAVGGPVEIMATSEGQQGGTSARAVEGIVTGIQDTLDFLDTCPTNDPAYATIRQDFELRENGQLLGDVSCVEPYPLLPIEQLTDELVAVQVLRTAYHMSPGTEGRLPWTSESLYDWMGTNIAGINLKTAPGQLYCCDVIDGNYYISMSRQDDVQRNDKRTWMGIANLLSLYAHEIRHADPVAPGHVNGCAAFPAPTDPAGCDPTYELSNLGGYGVAHWLEASWATGYLHVGFSCVPWENASQYVSWNVGSANSLRQRFVEDVPPEVTGTITFGGPCP